MTILRNDRVHSFEKGNYCKPHHIVVKVTAALKFSRNTSLYFASS